MPAATDTTRDPGPELPDVKLRLATAEDPAVGRIVRNEICTAPKAAGFIRHIEFDITGSALAGGFRAGQAFGVLPPGADDKGRPQPLRLYSLACPSAGEDGAGNVLSTTVKRLIDERWEGPGLHIGVASNYLCNLREGDEVRLTGPSGKRFLLPARPEEHDYLFFATGTGIAPFRGMIKELIELNPDLPSRVTLIMGAPYETDLIYHGWLTRLDAEHERFSYITALSRQPQIDPASGAADGAGRMYVQDRLRTNRDELLPLLCSDRTLVYMCGLVGMEIGILRRFSEILPAQWLGRYVTIDAEAMAAPQTWERKMIGRQVKPSRRMFIETY
ncbi:MAG: hypothetical protein ACF8R7_13620 [Phycisphaerales bacterium JB039]